jgi:hypothetical protein
MKPAASKPTMSLVGSLMTDDEAERAARYGRLFSCAKEKIYHDDTTSTTQEE